MIPGKATLSTTSRHAQEHPTLSYQPLFPGGPLITPAGFGSYRAASGVDQHRRALEQALLQGINLIDSSSNYGDGRAESLIGQVIGSLVGDGTVSRGALFIITKGGYIQGQNLALVEQRKQAGRPFPNVVNYAPGLDHCIHPDFLADQIQQSRHRLQVDCIDGYLLHNPEYYLMWADKWGRPLSQARDVYYQRLKAAFTYLEEAVERGFIQWYGISSNTFPNPADDPTFTSLAEVWNIAQSISSDHHF